MIDGLIVKGILHPLTLGLLNSLAGLPQLGKVTTLPSIRAGWAPSRLRGVRSRRGRCGGMTSWCHRNNGTGRFALEE
jgi:hypothetical protein